MFPDSQKTTSAIVTWRLHPLPAMGRALLRRLMVVIILVGTLKREHNILLIISQLLPLAAITPLPVFTTHTIVPFLCTDSYVKAKCFHRLLLRPVIPHLSNHFSLHRSIHSSLHRSNHSHLHLVNPHRLATTPTPLLHSNNSVESHTSNLLVLLHLYNKRLKRHHTFRSQSLPCPMGMLGDTRVIRSPRYLPRNHWIQTNPHKCLKVRRPRDTLLGPWPHRMMWGPSMEEATG